MLDEEESCVDCELKHAADPSLWPRSPDDRDVWEVIAGHTVSSVTGFLQRTKYKVKDIGRSVSWFQHKTFRILGS